MANKLILKFKTILLSVSLALIFFAMFFSMMVGFFLFYPTEAKAAILFLELEQEEYNIGDTFIVSIKLDSAGEYINAVQGGLQFSQEILEVKDFSHGNSILTLWVEEPTFSNSSGLIIFSGGTPNGFEGKAGLLGRIIFKAGQAGQAKIKFLDNTKTLLNDSLGTEAKLEVKNAIFKIRPEEEEARDEWSEDKKNDRISPESFKIYLKKESTLFNGQFFVAFSAVDKQTGLDYYEVKEGKSDWQKARSPFLLKNQLLAGEIRVKAVDKAGNERIEIIYPEFYPELPPAQTRGLFKIVLFIASLIILCYILIKIVKK